MKHLNFTPLKSLMLKSVSKCSNYSQKLTSWVSNDQPCECAGVGAMLDNRPARQNGLKKIIPRVIPRIVPFGSDFIYTNFRRGRDLDFTYTKNRRGRDRDFSYINFRGGFIEKSLRKMSETLKTFPRCGVYVLIIYQ